MSDFFFPLYAFTAHRFRLTVEMAHVPQAKMVARDDRPYTLEAYRQHYGYSSGSDIYYERVMHALGKMQKIDLRRSSGKLLTAVSYRRQRDRLRASVRSQFRLVDALVPSETHTDALEILLLAQLQLKATTTDKDFVDRQLNYVVTLLALYVYDHGFSLEYGLRFFEVLYSTKRRLETLAECERAGAFERLCPYSV